MRTCNLDFRFLCQGYPADSNFSIGLQKILDDNEALNFL
jgi:hypothetical protein